ncbi:hypothetical protein HYH02_015284 [Chlamydomonas schloesseri]|uniref:DUF4371 domain-containing protein n=1 Tax=Chlamydomonas schloesseri TaxID=2026947 RepID=A0A835SB64_9CHLO|nr:hypothetical protein HYH02_015284 [Chlamydomonas schloesseri]|eukprot:KAG2423744.1 hypothetical protein HYH02_015284 [Chlamydomonas schloesseri]
MHKPRLDAEQTAKQLEKLQQLREVLHLLMLGRPMTDFRRSRIKHRLMETPHRGEKSTHWSLVWSFAEALDGCVKEEIKAVLRRARFISVSLDEATACDNTAWLSVHVYVLEDFERKVIFLNLEKVVGDADALGLKLLLLDALKFVGGLEEEDLARKLVNISTDGASVMRGQHSGLAVRMAEVAPFLLSLHCFAHRTDLAVGVLDNFRSVQSADALVHGVYNYFARSTARMRVMADLAKALRRRFRKMLKDVETRWISMSKPLDRTLSEHDLLLDFFWEEFQAGGDGAPTADGIYRALTDAETYMALCGLVPGLRLMQALIKQCQQRYVFVGTLSMALAELRRMLRDMYVEGPDCYDPSTFPAFSSLKHTGFGSRWSSISGRGLGMPGARAAAAAAAEVAAAAAAAAAAARANRGSGHTAAATAAAGRLAGPLLKDRAGASAVPAAAAGAGPSNTPATATASAGGAAGATARAAAAGGAAGATARAAAAGGAAGATARAAAAGGAAGATARAAAAGGAAGATARAAAAGGAAGATARAAAAGGAGPSNTAGGATVGRVAEALLKLRAATAARRAAVAQEKEATTAPAGGTQPHVFRAYERTGRAGKPARVDLQPGMLPVLAARVEADLTGAFSSLLDELHERFPSEEQMDAFAIVYSEYYGSDFSEADFNKRLDTVIATYGVPRVTESGVEVAALLNAARLRDQKASFIKAMRQASNKIWQEQRKAELKGVAGSSSSEDTSTSGADGEGTADEGSTGDEQDVWGVLAARSKSTLLAGTSSPP